MLDIKPKDFDPTKKYPVFMYQYSGPGSQQVTTSGTVQMVYDVITTRIYCGLC
jgi:dipeptidyl-peptidase-4